MPYYRFLILVLVFFIVENGLVAQSDSSRHFVNNTYFTVKDSLKNFIVLDSSSKKPAHIPRIATRRSLIIPGWGQAYNREYWKIPIVYAAIAIPVYTYFYNTSYYKKTSYAYTARFNQMYGDTTSAAGKLAIANGIAKIDPQLVNLDIYSLETYRNLFRKDRDYSILWFLILWGVNVADATVFAHLKDFDVSDNLAMHVEPSFHTSNGFTGVSFSINFKPKKHTLSFLNKEIH